MSVIPDGWVRMASYDDRQDKRHGNPGDNYRLLLSAAKSHQIRVQTIPGVRGMLVVKDEADAFIESNSTHDALPELVQELRDLVGRIEAAL